MDELRDIDLKGIYIFDDWMPTEECNHLVWSFEYDGKPVLWNDVKRGDGHFPRRLGSWLGYRTEEARATEFLYSVRDAIEDKVGEYLKYRQLFSAFTYLEAIVNAPLKQESKKWWAHYESVLFLNDDYTGGEIILTDRNVRVIPRAGSLLVLPAGENWITHPVKGKAYRLVSKHTDNHAYREDDLSFDKKLFVPAPHTPSRPKSAPPQRGQLSNKKKSKKKGCSSCTEARKNKGQTKVTVKNNKTGEVKEIWKPTEEVNRQFAQDTPKGRGGIII